MTTIAPTGTHVLDHDTIYGLCTGNKVANATWYSYQSLCRLVAFAHQNPGEPSTVRLLDIELTNDGLLTHDGFCSIMAMAAMTHGKTIGNRQIDEVGDLEPEIAPPMYFIDPAWTRLDQVALIHLHDALVPSF